MTARIIAPPPGKGLARAPTQERSLASMIAAPDVRPGDSILIMGEEKTGKTSSFAFGAPRPFFLFTDRMGDKVLPASFQDKVKPEAWDVLPGDREPPITIMGTLRALLREDHPYQTVILDTINRAQVMLWAWICEVNKVRSIEEVGGGYGKGYTAALEQINAMIEILFALSERKGMNWIIIGHPEAKTGNNPSGDEYERWQLAVNGKAAGALLGAVNTILFAEPQVEIRTEGKGPGGPKKRGGQTGVTRAIVRSKQGVKAGSRWLLPPDFLLSWAVYEQEKATGERLREELYRHLATLDTAARAEADTYLGQNGWSRAAVEQVIAGLRVQTDTNTNTDSNAQEEKESST